MTRCPAHVCTRRLLSEAEEQTRVRIKYRGHEKSPMHQHSRGVVVFSARPISNSLFQKTLGKSFVLAYRVGTQQKHALWLDYE